MFCEAFTFPIEYKKRPVLRCIHHFKSDIINNKDHLHFSGTENIYVQFEDRTYEHIVGITMGTHCAPLIADVFLYCYEKHFISNRHKRKRTRSDSVL